MKDTLYWMPLSEKHKRHLRTLAHDRKVVVQTGAAGLTDAVVSEVDGALTAHELLKVQVLASERTERDRMIGELCSRTNASLVQRIGHVAVIYRPHPEAPKITLPR